MFFMQHLLKISMEVEKCPLRISGKQRTVKVFSCLILFETAQVQAFSTQAVKTSKLFAEAMHMFYCQATEISGFLLPLVCA